MRVTAYLHSGPPARVVGGERMTMRLMAAAAAAGWDARVVVETATEETLADGVRVIPQRRQVDARLALDGADVLVTHPELARRIQRWPGAKVGIVHNLGRATVANSRRFAWSALVANGPVVAAALPHATDVIYPPAEAPEPPTAGLPRAFVTVVNLSKEKGRDVAQAVADAHPRMPLLTVVGGHGVQVPLLGPRVTEVGHGPTLGLPLALTRVLLAPSESETYGMVVAEATLAGVPVVASDLPAHRDVLGPAGTFFPVGDGRAAARAVARLFNDREAWCGAARRARERAVALEQRREAGLAAWCGLLARLVA